MVDSHICLVLCCGSVSTAKNLCKIVVFIYLSVFSIGVVLVGFQLEKRPCLIQSSGQSLNFVSSFIHFSFLYRFWICNLIGGLNDIDPIWVWKCFNFYQIITILIIAWNKYINVYAWCICIHIWMFKHIGIIPSLIEKNQSRTDVYEYGWHFSMNETWTWKQTTNAQLNKIVKCSAILSSWTIMAWGVYIYGDVKVCRKGTR